MTAKAGRKRGLGMGLSALMGGADADIETGGSEAPPPSTLPIEHLRPSPHQPRRYFADDEIEALAQSIRSQGLVQPLVVRPSGTSFEIVAGERRWRAAQRAGLHDVPVVIRELNDQQALELALIENVQRQDLTPIEEASAYRRLIDDFGHTQDALARALGKSRSHVANTLRLLHLPEPIRAMMERGELSAGHARALLACDEPERIAQQVVAGGLNVRQTEDLVRRAAAGTTTRPPVAARPRDVNITTLEQDLRSRLGLRVDIKPKGRQGGVISFAYSTLDQLDGLLRRIEREA
ncbi:ParB/RepB/Spo0J family partition protein [Marinivivus vitaminiproducens]|uniref:ParB/RepB/Spo0J family partition protein n=1 Tax=Marinivivus vitaminiproducens TaxID=3035935 RepID=UPI00279D4B11|nr:ParB/RepB/Spo0J family partition protein [Geminicoccaceae bacterium SCSIO 64248]